MPLSENAKRKQSQYRLEYAKRKYKRVPLDLPLAKYDEIKTYCAKNGETVNGFIKKAIEMRLQSNN